MPGTVDSNSPAFWLDGQLHVINSTGGERPLVSRGADQNRLEPAHSAQIGRQQQWPVWIEAVWVDPTGVIFAWYHQEVEWLCGAQRPAMPQIGSAMSYDGGKTFFDAGIVLSSPDPVNCAARNGYFAGGHGDFTVVLDREERYFYFLFSNYGGVLRGQGISVARMAYNDRFSPVGHVWKFHQGEWREPGTQGRSTPIFRASVPWQRENTDSFWGPSVHWNTHLRSFVMLLNRSCCTSGFPQEGIYVSFNRDVGDPSGWSEPTKLLDDTGWYPQVIGLGRHGTDSLSGQHARLYVNGQSRWRLIFHREPGGDDLPFEKEEPR